MALLSGAPVSARCRWFRSMWTTSSPSKKKKSPTPSCCCWSAKKTLAEGAGAAALAALVNRKLPFVGKKVAVLVCGGNIDVTLLSRIIERGLVKDGRLVRLRVHLPDYPGALNR